MAEKREVFERVQDEHGRTLMDRPLTPEEAAEQNARNVERLGGRTNQFDPFRSGTEQEARAKRSKPSMRSRAG